jgi:hypothetical protein
MGDEEERDNQDQPGPERAPGIGDQQRHAREIKPVAGIDAVPHRRPGDVGEPQQVGQRVTCRTGDGSDARRDRSGRNRTGGDDVVKRDRREAGSRCEDGKRDGARAGGREVRPDVAQMHFARQPVQHDEGNGHDRQRHRGADKQMRGQRQPA